MRSIVLACVVLLAAACGSSPSPVAPTPVVPVIPSCQSNNTASVSFGNKSVSSTYTVTWDGITAASLAPGVTSSPITVAAGVAHTLKFIYANTSVLACSISAPVPAQCSTPVYTCSF